MEKKKSLLQPVLNKIKVGIDLMGCETPETVLFDHVIDYIRNCKESIIFYIFASEELKQKCHNVQRQLKNSAAEVVMVGAIQALSPHEDPLQAIRNRKEFSLKLGMQYLKEEKIDGLVTAGNTGALVALAKILFALPASLSRPALVATVPTKKKPLAVLDVGANVPCKAQYLLQFAYMGVAFQQIHGIATPIVGLLNIGSEAIKGTSEMQKAYALLHQQKSAEYIFAGNVEAKEVFKGDVDVLITEGFVGNVFLKTAEGIANFILDKLENTPPKKSAPLLKDLQNHLHYGKYPGALLIGPNKTIIKCHGYSSATAFITGIDATLSHIKEKFCSQFTKKMHHILPK